MINRSVHVIYCDDIRYEVAHKTTIVGVYHNRMHVDPLPSALPKLVILATATTPADNAFRQLAFRVKRDNIVIGELSVGAEDIQRHKTVEPNTPATGISASATFTLSPFPVDGPCVISVEVETESEVLDGPALHISGAPAA